MKTLPFGARAVIGKVQRLVDDRVHIARPVLARAGARVQQHVPDDGIGTLAVLHDLREIALQHLRQLGDVLARPGIQRRALQFLRELVDQFHRQGREIVDEIQRVLDLVRDAGSELAEGSELFRLHQPVSCAVRSSSSDAASSRVLASTSRNNRTFWMAITRLVGEALDQLDLARRVWPDRLSAQRKYADHDALAQQWHAERRP